MIPLPRLKKDVLFNNELTHVVDVMKGIAAARFHVLERQLVLFERFFKTAGEILELVDIRNVDHPFVKPSVETVGAILVTSNSGFLGSLNAQVVHSGLSEGGAKGLLTVIGERGVNYVKDAGRPFTDFPGIEDASRSALALSVRDHVVRQVLRGECGRLIVVYPKPISFAVQKIMVEVLLPCSAWVPQGEKAKGSVTDLICESRMEDIVEYVVTQWIGHRLNEIFALSRLAELSARAVYLEGSYQELLQRGKNLKLQYLRARHEVIDRRIREIFAAQLLHGRAHAH